MMVTPGREPVRESGTLDLKGMTNIGHQPTRLEKVRLAYIFWATTPDSYYILI